MTRIASRLHFRRKAQPRFGVASQALLLGLCFVAAAAAPAAAACTAGPLTIRTADQPTASYTCTRNCAGRFGARQIRTVNFTRSYADRGGATVPLCLNECIRTVGCTAVSYWIVVTDVYGRAESTITCYLWGNSDIETADSPPGSYLSATPGGGTSFRISNAGVCYRDPAIPLRNLPLEIDTKFHQDQFRPNIPPGGSPAGQYRGK